MNDSSALWRLRRLGKMSPAEVRCRIADDARQQAWRRHQVHPGHPQRPLPLPVRGNRVFSSPLPAGALQRIPEAATEALLESAEQLMQGRWEVLGLARKDMIAPDWFFDPVTRKRAPQREYCFSIDHRREDVTGNIKNVWELSRMQHLTVLAGAFAVTGDERFAVRVARHLRSWWRANPCLSGVNWASGIELGLRLISWVWVRRLLDDWAEAPRLFERNDAALEQIWWHQHYLAAFRSRGSSANNHLVAEAAGLLVGALAFPWFTGSEEQAGQAAAFLERSLADNTFPSGVNREMAFDYHGFVAEVALVAGAEADLAGRPLSDGFWRIVTGMLDAAAASLDVNLRGPRYGDGDDGRALVIGPRNTNRWTTLMSTGRGALGVPDWWPECDPDVASTLLAALIRPRRFPRPERRQAHFADAGMTILRTPRGDTPEIWCRCDAGPHGFLSIAAHAHADALSLEVRHDGIDILADPGTYCYHGEPAWRSYFRSTAAHNTLEVAGRSQSTAGGPFLWRRHANAKLIVLAEGEDGEVTGWAAEHDGYLDLNPPVIHRRQVNLVAQSRHIEIRDIVRTAGPHTVRLAFHVGPTVSISVGEGSADLRWPGPDSSCRQATLRLPGAMKWVVIEGSIDPVLGWYSRGFGEKDPSAALVGADVCLGYTEYVSVLQFQ